MNTALRAIIKKDFHAVTSNRRLFSAMLIVPVVLAVFLPSVFILTLHFAPKGGNFQSLSQLLPPEMQTGSFEQNVLNLLLNNIFPLFFLIIPIMISSIMAASSFVGEKERHTLETLLYCPLSLNQIFFAKVTAAFLASTLVSLISFAAMGIVVEIEVFLTLGNFWLPGIGWLPLLLLVAPAVSMISITLIVRGSAKAKSVEESQQSAVFLVLPIILLVVGQFTGMMFLSSWLLLLLGGLCAILAWILLRKAMAKFSYERLLK